MTAPAGIIWLASFPKSGNTWFRIFLANLTAAEDAPLDINDLNERGDIASSRYEFEAATLLDSGLISHDDIDRLRPRVYERIATEVTEQRWVKVHEGLIDVLEDGLGDVLGRERHQRESRFRIALAVGVDSDAPHRGARLHRLHAVAVPVADVPALADAPARRARLVGSA